MGLILFLSGTSLTLSVSASFFANATTVMDPQSRERLLTHDAQSRRSQDSRPSSDSDLDATDYLNIKTDSPTSHGTQVLRNRSTRFQRCLSLAWKLALLIGVLLLLVVAFLYRQYDTEPRYGDSPPWYPSPRGGTAQTWADSYAKAEKMVARMTLAEKVNVTTGTGWMMDLAVGTTAPALLAGFPKLYLQDGPLGIRFADGATAFPAGITTAATWNRDLIRARGEAHAKEARAKGINVLLGPCVGPLGRMPAGGRNWEGFGPDPYLAGVAGSETIVGIQSQHVMATIKHFVGNEQEHFRQPWEWGLPHALSANIGDRALHELYAWPFGDAVRAGVASVMCSYNMVNNSYACGNSKLLNGVLKDELGFQGFVMSDWLAQRGGMSSALSGLDMSMPGDGLKWQDGISLWGPELSRSVLNGSVPLERLNDMVTRVVAAWYQLGQDDKTLFPDERPSFSSWTNEKMGVEAPGSDSPQDQMEVNKFVNVQSNHSAIARQVAAEGTVMLKNDMLLPISPMGYTDAKKVKRHNGKLKVAVFGEDAGPGLGPNYCKDRGCNQGTLGSGWGSGAVEFPWLITPADALRESFNMSMAEYSEYLTNTPDLSAAKDQDVCVVFANADSGEGFLAWGSVGGDRPDLYLQKGGDDLILSVANACEGDVLVVIHSVGPVLMERWIDHPSIKAILYASLPGQESGNAIADVIFGRVNPSGKLPYTIGKSLDDYGPGAKVLYFPNAVVPQQDFDDGIFIDYRHFDRAGTEPRFEFGFGLSYTDFEYADLKVETLKEKSPLPAARPQAEATPPSYSTTIPDGKEAIFPEDLRKLNKYVYPYLEADEVEGIEVGQYPMPEGYDTPQEPSPAGGAEGGNPDLWTHHLRVTVNVRNIGAKAGYEVAQLYLSYPEGMEVEMPVRVLRGFEKVWLEKGETKAVNFELKRRDLSYWDVVQQNWVMATAGEYGIAVGASSRDLRVKGTW
jgi:beta-glucosidase